MHQAAILDRNNSARFLKLKAAELAKIVEATPTVTNQQKIDLGLSVRATPAPKGPPATPSDFR